MCVHLCVRVCVCTHVCRSQVNFRCLPRLLSTLFCEYMYIICIHVYIYVHVCERRHMHATMCVLVGGGVCGWVGGVDNLPSTLSGTGSLC